MYRLQTFNLLSVRQYKIRLESHGIRDSRSNLDQSIRSLYTFNINIEVESCISTCNACFVVSIVHQKLSRFLCT